jgi:Na+/H+ antiporter NhaD/arsenite permease-like protein
MPRQLIDTPQSLDTALVASQQARREKFARRVQNQRIRTRIVFGLSTCIALFALVAYLIRDYAAARFCFMAACVCFTFAYFVGAAARKQAINALRDFDWPA